ncbi:MAG: hypothetical protein Kow0080_02140 [Candidatus Promineifilaceae bacterium]
MMINERTRWRVALGLLGATAVLLYSSTLHLPLIYDTLLHIRITKGLTFANVWLPTEAFGFYRPLTFFPMLVIKAIWGYYPNWLLHGINVVQHALNAVLLAALVKRLGQNWQTAVTAGLLFTFYPFSFQAVAVYGHNVHPTTAGLLLLALHTYLSAISPAKNTSGQKQTAVWWLLTAVLFILSLLSHESAILFGTFALLVHLAAAPTPLTDWQSWLRRLRPAFIFLALGALYAVVYQFLPITRAPQAGGDSMGGLVAKVLYVIQAAVYPLAWFGQFVPDGWKTAVLWASGLATAVWSGYTAWQSKQWRMLLLAWGWWALAAAVIVLPLSAGYLLRGPRLLYLSSVGVSIAWAFLLQDTGEYANRRWRRLAVLFVLVTSGWFVAGRLRAYAQLTQPVQAMQTAVSAQPNTEYLLFVNLPQWLAPPQTTFPVGAEFVTMLGDYLFVEELAWENGAPTQTAVAVTLPDLLAQTRYGYAVHAQSELAEVPALEKETAVILTTYGNDTPTAVYRGGWSFGNAAAPIAASGPYQLTQASALVCNDQIQVTLHWRPETAVSPTTSIFVQAFSADGQLIAQSDGPPTGLRPDLLPPTAHLLDVRHLPTATQSPTWLLIGTYDYTTGERLPAFDAAGSPLSDNAYQLPVQPCQN